MQRAKERSRLKKQQLQQEQQLHQQQLPHDQLQQSQEASPESQNHSRTNSRLSNKSIQELYSVPARKPYLNPEAIDSHVSSCGEDTEPQYENIQKKQNEIVTDGGFVRISGALPNDGPVPPYMPMQQSNSKKTSSLEKRILKKKEKEGCKQQ